MTWQNPRILCILLLVFVCGATAGALAVRWGSAYWRPSLYFSDGGKMVSLDRMRKELNLTPQQSKEMEEVLGDFVMYFQTLTEQMKELRGSARARIMQILDEEQRRKCLRLLGEMQSKSPR